MAGNEELWGLCFETVQKVWETVLYFKMYSDDLEPEDVKRWLEGWVQKILDVECVLDQWQVWTGAWKARESYRKPEMLQEG